MKIVGRLVICLFITNIIVSATVQEKSVSISAVYDYLVCYNHAKIVFQEKKTLSTKTKVLLAKTNLLNAVMNLCNNPEVSVEQKELCLNLIRSVCNDADAKILPNSDMKMALNHAGIAS